MLLILNNLAIFNKYCARAIQKKSKHFLKVLYKKLPFGFNLKIIVNKNKTNLLASEKK